MKILDLKKSEKKLEGIFLEWTAEGSGTGEKNWQIGIAIFFTLSFFFFLWQKNFFGIILILIISFLIFFSPIKKGETHFSISKRGVRIEKEIFPWSNLKSFWIFEEPPEMYLESKKSYLPYIIVPLPEDFIEKAREILLKFLPEKETERSFFDILSKKLGI